MTPPNDAAPSTLMAIERTVAREAIRDTVHRYCGMVDEGRYDELDLLMTPDAILSVGDLSLQGLDAIRAALAAGALRRRADQPGHFQRHNITSSRIDVIGQDVATGFHYLMITSELGLDVSGTYDDRYRRCGDQWLIAERVARVDWMRADSRFSSAGPAT